MKRLIIIGVLLFALSLAIAPISSASYTDDERSVVEIASGTVDVSDMFVFDAGDVTLPLDENETLPSILDNWDKDNTWFGVYADGEDIEYNLTLNGVVLATSTVLTDGNTDYYNLTDAILGGVDEQADYLHLQFDVNSTAWEAAISYALDDGPLTSSWIASAIEVTETDNSTANVGGIWGVNDTIVISNDLAFNITDLDLKLDYPSSVVSDNPNLWLNDTEIDILDDATYFIYYQKYGPAHDEDGFDITASSGSVVITFDDDIDEMDDAEWTIDPTDDIWDDAFVGIDYASLVITDNDDDEVDWEEGSIVIDSIDIDPEDEITFAWSTGTGGTTTPGAGEELPDSGAPTAPDWNTEVAAGVPMWAVVAIVVVCIFTIVAVMSIEKK